VQLGELQSQISRFKARGVSVVALSVDEPADSSSMIRRLNLAFPVASDQDQKIMQAYGVQNPDTQELALHAVFIVDETRNIFYRKVASRRPLSQELLDAIDYQKGTYPLGDAKLVRGDIPVAFPQNYFQALLEISRYSTLPQSVDPEKLTPVIGLLRQGKLDDALISYRRFVEGAGLNEQELLSTAAWLTKRVLGLTPDALQAGRQLNSLLQQQRLARETGEEEQRDEIAWQLDEVRESIRENASAWRLNAAKSTLRSYREVSLAALR
jgi:hypothetical protein